MDDQVHDNHEPKPQNTGHAGASPGAGQQSGGGGINPMLLQALLAAQGGGQQGSGINPMLLQALMGQQGGMPAAWPQGMMGGMNGGYNPMGAMGGMGGGMPNLTPEMMQNLSRLAASLQNRSQEEWMAELNRAAGEQRAAGTLDAARVRREMEQLLPMLDPAGAQKMREIMQRLGL
nr:hypothetical protein [bacterium]